MEWIGAGTALWFVLAGCGKPEAGARADSAISVAHAASPAKAHKAAAPVDLDLGDAPASAPAEHHEVVQAPADSGSGAHGADGRGRPAATADSAATPGASAHGDAEPDEGPAPTPGTHAEAPAAARAAASTPTDGKTPSTSGDVHSDGIHGDGIGEDHRPQQAPPRRTGPFRLLAPSSTAALARAWTTGALGDRVIVDEPVTTTEESLALANVAAARADAAVVHRLPTDAEMNASRRSEGTGGAPLLVRLLGAEALVPVAPPTARVKSLRVADLQAFLLGTWEWRGVETVLVAGDTAVVPHIRRALLSGAPVRVPVRTFADDRGVMRALTGGEAGIAVVGRAAVGTAKPLPLVDASGRLYSLADTHSWPLMRPIFLVVRGDAPAALDRVIEFALSDDGRAVAVERGFLPPEAWTRTGTTSIASGPPSP